MTTELRRLAKRRAKARLGFYVHATVFVFVNAAQLGINLLTTPLVFWSVFPMLGWGLGLAVHGLVVWFKTSDWLEDELERMNPQQFTSSTGEVSVTVRDAD